MSNILKITFNSKNELAKAYIRQFKHGGIFIVNNLNYSLNEELFLIIKLPKLNESVAVSGKVSWISPASAVAYPCGSGIHFSPDKAGQDAKAKIEMMVGGLVQNNNEESYTF